MVQKDGFKPYHREQTFPLPPLEEFVPPNLSARIISAVVDKLDLTNLYNRYNLHSRKHIMSSIIGLIIIL